MARTKEFDRDAALDLAMEVFWRKGYEATSLSDLIEAMGIARQSLYDTFGDKHALFLEAFSRYEDQQRSDLLTCLQTAPSKREAFARLFQAIIDQEEGEKRKGCLGINTIIELSPHDADIAKFIAARQRSLETVFFNALEQAKKDGEISDSKDTKAIARFIVGSMMGLRVAAKADPRTPILRDMARISLQALD